MRKIYHNENKRFNLTPFFSLHSYHCNLCCIRRIFKYTHYSVKLMQRKTKSLEWNESVYSDYIENVFIWNTRSNIRAWNEHYSTRTVMLWLKWDVVLSKQQNCASQKSVLRYFFKKFLLKKCIEIPYTLHPVFPTVSILCNYSIGSKPGNGLWYNSQNLFRFFQFSLHSFVCMNSSMQFYYLCRFMYLPLHSRCETRLSLQGSPVLPYNHTPLLSVLNLSWNYLKF